MDHPYSPFLDPGSPSPAPVDLEQRVTALEAENRDLRNKLEVMAQNYIKTGSSASTQHLPHTALLSDSFLNRAFAVWGHYFVAQLIIAVPIVLLYIILIVLVLSTNGLR